MKTLIIISFFCQNLEGRFVQERFKAKSLEWVDFFEEPNLHTNLQRRNFRYVILFYSSSQSFPYLIQTIFSALKKK
jgi:hypothetical protein